MDTTRILIVDDHPLIRRGIEAALSPRAHWEVVASAGTLAEGLEYLKDLKPDIAIVDLGLPDGSGFEFLAQTKQHAPAVKVIVSSMRDEFIFARRCIAEGARGYVAKQDSDESLVGAIEIVLAGETYLSNAVRNLSSAAGQQGQAASPFHALTLLSNRELSVFELIGMGYTTKQISERMGVKVKTVDSYRERIKNKLELGSSSELLQFATRWVVSLEEVS